LLWVVHRTLDSELEIRNAELLFSPHSSIFSKYRLYLQHSAKEYLAEYKLKIGTC